MTHNVKLPGHDSGVLRQIDVLVSDRVGQFPIQIAIECKDLSVPADVTVVDSFAGLLSDTRIPKGVLVCPSGFTQAALNKARAPQIETYSPVDTDPHKWSCKVSLPTICDFRGAQILMSSSFSQPLPCMIPADTASMVVLDDQDNPVGTIGELLAARWERGEFPTEPGVHERLPIGSDSTVRMDDGYGRVVPFTLVATIAVIRQRFFGQTPIAKARGFRDEQTGTLITNAFQLGLLDPEIVLGSWTPIPDDEEAPPASLLVFGLKSLGVHSS